MPTRGGSIHVATTRRVYKDKVYETHLLRRTFREDGKVKHETLGNLSHLPVGVIDLVRRSLKGERFFAEGDLEVAASRAHGAVALVLGVVRDIGLDAALGRGAARMRALVVAMIVSRLLSPQSKLGTHRWWETTTLREELGLDDVTVDDLYAAMDWVVARQQQIERRLVAKHLQNGALVLYDLSSSYFTGRKCSLAKRGYSRDHRSDLPQVNYGVITDGEGCPVAVEVFEGNIKDCTTVVSQVARLQERYGIRQLVVVGDRGMITQVQVDALRAYPGVDWITALTNPQARELFEAGVIQMSLFDARNLAEVSSDAFPGERLVVCRNPGLARLRAESREALLVRTEERLRRISAAVEAGRLRGAGAIGERVGRAWKNDKMRKHFRIEVGEAAFIWRRDEEAIRAEASLDGLYVVRTSLPKDDDHPPERIVQDYKRLAKVERVFRTMKTTELLVRPIFHREPDRVRGHIFLCMLSAHVHWHLEKRLAPLLFVDQGLDAATREPVAPPVPSAEGKRKRAERTSTEGLPLHSMRTLLSGMSTITRNTLRVKSAPDSTWTQLTTPTPWQRQVFELARVPLQ